MSEKDSQGIVMLQGMYSAQWTILSCSLSAQNAAKGMSSHATDLLVTVNAYAIFNLFFFYVAQCFSTFHGMRNTNICSDSSRNTTIKNEHANICEN